MQIEPRLMKEMIRLQMTNDADITSASLQSNGSSRGKDDNFQTMLEQLMFGGLPAGGGRGASSFDQPLFGYGDVMESVLAWSEPTDTASSHSAAAAPTAYDDMIARASAKYGVDELLVKAVIRTESSFRPNAVSSAGAKGLMQLMDGTARGLGVTDSFDPEQNIDGGTRYLSYQLKRFGGHEKVALAAYNAGPNRIAQLGIRTEQDLMDKYHLLPKETQNYIRKIEEAKHKLA